MIVTSWSKVPENPAYDRCSPNLQALEEWLEGTFHFRALGCYGERPVRGKKYVSSAHASGAATDEGYGLERRDAKHPDVPDRAHALAVVDLVIDHHDLFGIQAVHDYIGARIWHADRDAWKPAAIDNEGQFLDPNMGGAWATWFHFETSREAWSWDTPIAARLAGTDTTTEVEMIVYDIDKGVFIGDQPQWIEVVVAGDALLHVRSPADQVLAATPGVVFEKLELGKLPAMIDTFNVGPLHPFTDAWHPELKAKWEAKFLAQRAGVA